MAKVLRPFQTELKSNIYTAWNSGFRNVLAVMPTGSGKTVSFCSIAVDFISMGQVQPVAICVHRKELVSQIALTLAEEGISHNIIADRGTIRGIVAEERKQFGKSFYDYGAYVTVLSVDTLNSRIEHHRNWAAKIKLWITDEAAHLLAKNKWGESVSYFPNAIGLGVTATPQRLDKRGLGRHADGVFDAMVEGPNTKWMIQNGFLCDYRIAVPQSDYLNHLKKASDGSDYTRQNMMAASAASHIIGDSVDNYIKFAKGKQAIYFASDIFTGKKMEEKFNATDIKAKLLTGDTDDSIRLSSMNDFRERKIQVLINVDLFDEGLDVPGIEVVGMCRPTESLGKYLQMIGRGLRPAKGKLYAIIIDHVGNVARHGLPDRARKWTLDRIVKRRDTTNLLRFCDNTLCNSPYDRAFTECPYCGQAAIRSSRASSDAARSTLEQVDGDLELLDPETLRQMYEAVELEAPADLYRRVAAVAGRPAAERALKTQQERIAMAKDLSEQIALWAGKMRDQGLGDRSINKKFYMWQGKTITMAVSEPAAEMRRTLVDIKGEL